MNHMQLVKYTILFQNVKVNVDTVVCLLLNLNASSSRSMHFILTLTLFVQTLVLESLLFYLIGDKGTDTCTVALSAPCG